MGLISRKSGATFEKQIEETFLPYANAGIAKLNMMPVPMAPSGIKHPTQGVPLYRPKGKAPFDVYGWLIKFGTFVGAELKTTTERKNTLPICFPVLEGADFVYKSKGGLLYHQLDCLNSVAASNGTARLVWCNAGEVGVLKEQEIMDLYRTAHETWQAELRGLDTDRATKSVRWERFQNAPYRTIGGSVIPDWLDEGGR